MPWFFQLIIAVFMVISYIAIFKELRTNPNFLDITIWYSPYNYLLENFEVI